MAAPVRPDAPDIIMSLQRGLEILRCFRHEAGSLSMPEIAVRAGVPKPTAHRLLHTLLHLGCVERLGNGRYRPGPRAMTLGRAVLGALPIRAAARPFMQALADRHQVGVALAAAPESLIGRTEMVVLQQCGGSPSGAGVRVGSMLRMAGSVMGAAHVWAMADDARRVLLATLEAEAGGDAPGLRIAMTQGFDALNARGYCTTSPAWRQEVCALAAPLRFNGQDTVLVMACMPAPGLDRKAPRLACGRDLVQTVAAVRDSLGGVDAAWLGIADSLARP